MTGNTPEFVGSPVVEPGYARALGAPQTPAV
jgi:hypothetical protein